MTSCSASFAGSTWTWRCGQPLAPDRHLGDPGNAEQPGADLPVGQLGHVDQVRPLSEVMPIFRIRLVADRAGIMNGGLAQVGSVAVIWAEALGHQLPGPELIGARVEEHEPDRRRAGRPTWTAGRSRPSMPLS